jgi:hypothetical protein
MVLGYQIQGHRNEEEAKANSFQLFAWAGKVPHGTRHAGGGGELTGVRQLGPRDHQTRKGKHGETEGIMGMLTER